MYLQADAVTKSRPSDARDETQRGLRIVERTETRQKRALDKVMDTEPSTTHGCDIFSELQAVGLAGSVSIAQPIIETTVVLAGDHARLLAQINRKFGCIWEITYCSVSSCRKVRPASLGQLLWDTWTLASFVSNGHALMCGDSTPRTSTSAFAQRMQARKDDGHRQLAISSDQRFRLRCGLGKLGWYNVKLMASSGDVLGMLG